MQDSKYYTAYSKLVYQFEIYVLIEKSHFLISI